MFVKLQLSTVVFTCQNILGTPLKLIFKKFGIESKNVKKKWSVLIFYRETLMRHFNAIKPSRRNVYLDIRNYGTLNIYCISHSA